MKTLIAFLLAGCLIFTVGCKTTLEEGGPYAPEGQESDLAFFTVDAAFDVAYFTIDAMFKFERDNRVKLWKLNPEIKRSLDKVRPEAKKVVFQYVKARAVYITSPTPQGLSDLQKALSIAQRLATTASALIPKGN